MIIFCRCRNCGKLRLKLSSVRAETFAHNPAFPSSYYCNMKCLSAYSNRVIDQSFAQWQAMSDAHSKVRGYK